MGFNNMTVKYKGFEISVKREPNMAGYDLAYYYVMRLSDGWYMLDSFTEGNDAIMDLIDTFKGQVDAYLANKIIPEFLLVVKG